MQAHLTAIAGLENVDQTSVTRDHLAVGTEYSSYLIARQRTTYDKRRTSQSAVAARAHSDGRIADNPSADLLCGIARKGGGWGARKGRGKRGKTRQRFSRPRLDPRERIREARKVVQNFGAGFFSILALCAARSAAISLSFVSSNI